MAENEAELKSLLMRVKERGKKLARNSTLKKQRSWHPVPSLHGNRWGNTGNSERLYLGEGSSKITAVGDCSHEIKRHILLGRKVLTNLDSILKSRHYFANKGLPSQAMVFPVVMYGM